MQAKQKIQMLIDILMTILSIILMGGTVLFPDSRVHQILGMVLLALWLCHTILHRAWFASLFRGSYPPYRVMQIVVNGGISVCALLLMASGLMMAWFLPVNFGMEAARTMHLVSSHWYYLFMCAHLGMHMGMIFSRMGIKNGTEQNAKSLFAKRIFLALVCAYAVYAFIVRGVGCYLFLRQQFFFLDLERGYILFAVDYLAILVLFAAVSHYLGKILLAIGKQKTKTYNHKPLKSFNPLVAYAGVLFAPPAIIANFKCFATILKEFFFLQYFEKLHILHIPVVHVDHPLDEKIPFTPSKVSIYLDFINLWVRPLAMLVKKFGFWHASQLTKKWMLRFRKLYQCCGKIYHFRLTTTNRPNYKEMREFRQIHALDPHFLCVPSLHVATVFLAWGFYRKIFAEEDFTEIEKQEWEKELYDGAIEICETVLYVKQHSVNCIPAALYLAAVNFPEFVSVADARKFISELFLYPEGFTDEEAVQVRAHISATYEKYLAEGAKTAHWYEPIREFLQHYANSEKAIPQQ
ncbi:MAG: hypothetical protein IJ158_01205 [Treponema sp.]|nr:hypothetical protein [Treponema sp.]